MKRRGRFGAAASVSFAALLSLSSPAIFGAKDGGAFVPVRRAAAEAPLEPASPVWLQRPATTVTLYPQVSTAPAAAGKPLTAKLRALYSAKAIAIHLEWRDSKAVREQGIGKFADAVALQWPLDHGSGRALPYVGMGLAGSPVALWFWRADGAVETLAAQGFGTLTRQAPDGVEARGEWKSGVWRVVFRRALAATGEHRVHLDPQRQGLVPVAVAVWNGEAAERDGLKRLSAWKWLRFEGGEVEAAYIRQITGAIPAGDVERGKRLMTEKACAGCHSFPGNPAQPRVGPDLSYAGGVHSGSYLAESLAEPSKVIVPSKGYFTEQDGKRVSLMPPFVGTEAERNDLLAFLKSLR